VSRGLKRFPMQMSISMFYLISVRNAPLKRPEPNLNSNWMDLHLLSATMSGHLRGG
jgi:hypothetical protein